MDLSDKLFFPDYSRLERITDAVVHCIGVPLGLAAAALLVVRGPRSACAGSTAR